jgi:hypothetical protein
MLLSVPSICVAANDVRVREATTLPEVTPSSGLAFSAGGRLLVSMAAGYRQQGRVWEWQTGEVVATLPQTALPAPSKWPSRASPDGKYWAVCGYGVTVWDARTWHPVATLPGEVMCNAILFSRDGKQMIVAQSGEPGETGIVAYETGSWQPAWQVKTSPFRPASLAYSPDGRQLAAGGISSKVGLPGRVMAPGFDTSLFSQGFVAIVDLASHAIVKTIAVDDPTYSSSQDVMWERDGKRITFAATGALRTYEIASGREDKPILAEKPLAKPRAIRSPDGRFEIDTDFGEKHDTVLVVDISGTGRKIVHEIRARPMHVAWAPDSRHFALGGAAMSLGSLIPFGDLLVKSRGKIIVYEIL